MSTTTTTTTTFLSEKFWSCILQFVDFPHVGIMNYVQCHGMAWQQLVFRLLKYLSGHGIWGVGGVIGFHKVGIL
jgi:hypothetical protein